MKFYMERALFGVRSPSLPLSFPAALTDLSRFQLTVLGMKHADESVALQAVEFWSTVCDEEIELALEAEEAAEYSEAPERESSHFARVALPEILPVLLLLLTKQDEDATDDEWNVSMAAGTCLALLAQCVGDGIVSPIIPFVEGNIKSVDWRYREAAVMAFGSILDGPEEKILAPLVAQALPILIDMMGDSTAWTLGRVTDVLVKTIKIDSHLPPLVTALVSGLEQSPRIVSNCCWSIMNLAEQLGDASADTCPVSPYYDGLVSALLRLAERCVSSSFCLLPLRFSLNEPLYYVNSATNESNSRTSAYEALSTLATHAPADCLPVVSKLVIAILDRSEALLGMQVRLFFVC
jgi:importin subunit beta-1